MMTAAIKTVKIWLKAFIPNNLDSVEVVGGTGLHAGKTALPTPGPMDMWFLTDQRTFDSDIGASARMHSEIEINLADRTVTHEFHKCFESIEVDRETGAEKCREAADNSTMAFSDFQVSEDGKTISMELKGSSKNPCLKIAAIEVSPNLDYTGTIILTRMDSDHQIQVSFEGMIETYPAFELYASVNGASPVTIFREDVAPDATPLNLVGPPTREIAYQAILSAEN
jgi:hypothetical protein